MWQYRKLRSTPLPSSYENILQNIAHYRLLSPLYREKIQLLILAFIEDKEFIEAKMSINDEVKVIIAFYASLMRLGFDFGEKDDVSSVIVYPNHFIVDHSETNGGIRHNETFVLEGQSSNGAVAISWQDIKYNIKQHYKENVIIHEFAHELDFEDGLADGTPELESSSYRTWSSVFSNAFDALQKQKSSDKVTFLGTYALKNEAEFFAVCSERFFQAPKTLKNYFPDLYEALKDFYRLDTAVLFKDLSES
jgi:Mlc titration factor MtfA (ptsG expression regulator)